MNTTSKYFVISLFLMGLLSCSEDPDILYPKIQILLPYPDEKYNVLEKISVSAIISDDQTIEWIKVSLIDTDLQPVLPVSGFYPRTDYYELNSDYYLNDIQLQGGAYQLRISAFDGYQTSNAYVPVFIAEVPRVLDRMIILTREDEKVNVWSERQGIREWLFDIQSDYAGSAISSRYQQLYFTGNQQVNLACYDLSDFLRLWEVPPTTDPPYHYPGNLFVGNMLIYASFREGYIRGFDHNGVIKFATPFNEMIEPAAIFEHENRIIADIKEKSGSDRFIACYYLASGDERFRIKSGIEVVNFHVRDQENVFVIGNIDTTGCIMIYNIENNHHWSPHTFPNEKIVASVAIDEYNILIASESGIYRYQYNNNSLTIFIPDVPVHTLCYDDIQGQVYLVSDHSISACSYPSSQQTGQWISDQEILNLHLLYNK